MPSLPEPATPSSPSAVAQRAAVSAEQFLARGKPGEALRRAQRALRALERSNVADPDAAEVARLLRQRKRVYARAIAAKAERARARYEHATATWRRAEPATMSG